MNGNNSSIVQKIVSVFILWCMVAGGVFSLVAIETGGADNPSNPVPLFVPAVITDEFELIDAGVYDVDYSITINSGGTLRIVNTTLNFLQDASTDYSINVNADGILIMENSTITTAATELVAWDPVFSMNLDQANLTMTRNSALAFPGWLNVTDTRAYINDSWITSVYPEDMVYTEWASNFPTFINAVDEEWWTASPYDINLVNHDDLNDAPIMSFTDCENVTIADSRIDELYEDENLIQPVAFDVHFLPSAAATSPAPAGDVEDITTYNLTYMEVWAGLSAQTLEVYSFDTTGYDDVNYQVNSVQVHTFYNTSFNGVSGYNGTDYLEWRLDSGIYADLFLLENNIQMAENLSVPLAPTPSISDIETLDLRFINTDPNAAGTVFYDLIELIVNLQIVYSSYPTQIMVDNTNMSIINSYVGVDWLSSESDFSFHNSFNLTGNSNMYLYNMSYSEDEGGLTGLEDFAEIPDWDTRYEIYSPFLVEAGSQIYNYKWLGAQVVDKYGMAVEGAYFNSTFDYANPDVVNITSDINDLSDADTNYSKERIIAYMERMYGVDETNFNITGSDGKVMIPLLTEYINASCYPNGDHVGNYHIDVNYTDTTDYYAYITGDFTPYPNNLPEDNLIVRDLQLSDLELPRPFGSPGLIVRDSEIVDMDGGEEGSTLSIADFIIVEDSGQLTLSNYDFLMTYSGGAPFEIIVRNNGELTMNSVNMETLNNYPITITVEDNGVLTLTDTVLESNIDIKAFDSTEITFNRTDIGGSFEIMGFADVTLWAWDTEFSNGLYDIYGTSKAYLVGCSSPLSPNFRIYPADDAEVWIYRWMDVTVYDGMDPKNSLEDVHVWINNTNPEAGTGWDRYGMTDAEGNYRTTGLSNYLHYDDATGQVQNTAYNAYSLESQYVGTLAHYDTTGIGLASYPSMTLTNAVEERDVILENVLPDLDPPLTVEPTGANDTIGRGDIVWINTTISNLGDATAENIYVWINDTFEGDIDIIYEEEIEILMPGDEWPISFQYAWSTVDMLGDHNVTVMVDPMDYIPEQEEDNNFNYSLISIIPQADLAIQYNYDISFSQTYPLIDTDFDIMANVWNLGDIDATDVVVSFYEISTGTNILLGNDTIDEIPEDSSTPGVASITVNFDVNGIYRILAIIDEANVISEVDETNNNNSMWPRTLRVWEYAGLNIDLLDILIGNNPVEYGMGGGITVDECFNRTEVTLRARVWNTGELFASNVVVEFWDGSQSIGRSSTVSTINSDGYDYLMFTWIATSDDLEEDHNIRAIAYGTALQSNEATQSLTVYDDRPDLTLINTTVENNPDTLIDGNDFGVNVTLSNTGLSPAYGINIEVYTNESQWWDTTLVHNMGMTDQYIGRLGNTTVDFLANGNTVTVTIPCSSINEGVYGLFIFVDSELNTTDEVRYDSIDYDLCGDIEETNEQNNNGTLLVEVVIPNLMVRLVTPALGDNVWVSGETNDILVTGNVVRVDNENIGVAGIEIEIYIGYGDPIIVESGQGGLFSIGITAPTEADNYTVTVSGDDVVSGTAWYVIEGPGMNLMLWVIIFVLVIVGVIGGITAYLYFVGLGKTVQCGECGAFIPEGAKKCPKCNVEFEEEVAKCSICGAWVPIDVKNCPECKTEFTVGTEDLDDYEAKMKRQYDDIVRKFKDEAKGELGAEFTETEFQAWWATQATFVTFDQWLQEEEEMKRMGSKPCHSCGTENSVTAKICHKCGTVMEAGEEDPTPKPKGKAPAEAPKEAPKSAEVAAAPVPVEKAAEPSGEKKSCPSCGMEVGAHEKVCPICSFDFEKPPAGGDEPPATPPSGGDTAAPVKRVVKKPVKRVVKRPVQKE